MNVNSNFFCQDVIVLPMANKTDWTCDDDKKLMLDIWADKKITEGGSRNIGKTDWNCHKGRLVWLPVWKKNFVIIHAWDKKISSFIKIEIKLPDFYSLKCW